MPLKAWRVGLIALVAVGGVVVESRDAGAGTIAFSAKTLKGGYGCSASGTALGEQLMQLTFDGNGGISGSQVLGISEECEGTVSGTYSVSPSGMGKMTLTLTLSGQDDDGDFDCKGIVSGLIENFALVIEGKGKFFDIKARDGFLGGPPVTIPDQDTNSFIGTCKSQNM